MSMDSLFNQTMSIMRPVVTQDDTGGQVHTDRRIGADERCRVRELTERERVILGREGVAGTHRIYRTGTTTITADCWLRIDKEEYDVVRINDPQRMGHHEQIDAVLRK